MARAYGLRPRLWLLMRLATMLVGPVAMCCDILGVVGSNLKMVKFFDATFVDVA